MRKFVNDPRAAVGEMLEGLADLSPGLALIAEAGVILRAALPPPSARRVAVISGGGSGHEPAHAGYVGPGLLTAAVAGDVFTSPSVDQVLAAIRAAAGPAGALLVVKNYTGDVLNFGLAAELARAEGIPVESVIVADDVALRDVVDPDRRRGIAGTVLVHKVAGAAAEAGLTLAEVAAEARAAAAALRSMGVALGPCTVPAAGRPGFELPDDMMELGLGIHGEAGLRRVPRATADAAVAAMLEAILADHALPPGAQVALLVNGLGGTPPMELAIVARAALAGLRAAGLLVERAWCGAFLTAIEMPGCSLSVMALDAARLARLDAGAEAPAWPGGGRLPAARQLAADPSPPAAKLPGAPDAALRKAALAVADALDAAEAELTALDAASGDGDLGLSLARGAAAMRALPDGAFADAPTALSAVARALRRAIAGSSGPFYAAGLVRAARHLPARPGAEDWAAAFDAGVAAIAALGGAKPGDRTMLDALQPAAEALSVALRQGAGASAALDRAAAAAEAGARATAAMHPRRGRASYLGVRAIGTPDAGAVAVAAWLRGLANSLA
ncbi:dihydroxyacetone kinase subunit DhaK [Roseococcus sp. SDR]|uniref:dihydroxyacetone kinase family protein n=1 Tax=Roseococcus sp. SDR TaxID=2835532 RepID=UPI001BCB0708|nr:dihydroxyacetone kinase family protein [Roseococcus sp. SDR]MBS7791783.1 dihydroxyacetone kinase subunit DhaK [Roseococcus sp. SDR]MBV1847097.1 dihydroxyacetone kinase subunit DhaK [Roseococcus sp. SDR]